MIFFSRTTNTLISLLAKLILARSPLGLNEFVVKKLVPGYRKNRTRVIGFSQLRAHFTSNRLLETIQGFKARWVIKSKIKVFDF